MRKLHYRIRVMGCEVTVKWSRSLSIIEHDRLCDHGMMLKGSIGGFYPQRTNTCPFPHITNHVFCAPRQGQQSLGSSAQCQMHYQAIELARTKLAAWLTISRRLGIDTIFD